MPLTGGQRTALTNAEAAVTTLINSLAPTAGVDNDQKAIFIQYRRLQKYGESLKSHKDKG